MAQHLDGAQFPARDTIAIIDRVRETESAGIPPKLWAYSLSLCSIQADRNREGGQQRQQ